MTLKRILLFIGPLFFVTGCWLLIAAASGLQWGTGDYGCGLGVSIAVGSMAGVIVCSEFAK